MTLCQIKKQLILIFKDNVFSNPGLRSHKIISPTESTCRKTSGGTRSSPDPLQTTWPRSKFRMASCLAASIVSRFSNQNLSPWRVRENCSRRRHWNVGPTRAPGTRSSSSPAIQRSTLSIVPYRPRRRSSTSSFKAYSKVQEFDNLEFIT